MSAKNIPPPSISTSRVSTREIWNLTWPQFLMMLFQFMNGFADVIVTGQINAGVQAAFGMVIQCYFFVLIVGITIAGASVSAMSQSLGAKKALRAKRYLGLVFTLGGIFCIISMFVGFLFRNELMAILQVPEEIMKLTVHIFVIYLLILPSEHITIFSSAVYRAHKKVSIPLATAAIVLAINVFLDYGIGLGYWGLPNLGADGVAYATMASSIAGALFNLYMLFRKGYLQRSSFAPLRWQKKAVKYLIKVAIPSGGMQTLWQLGYLVLFAITASLPAGEVTAVAGMTAGMRIESILFLPAVAFNFTGTILVGHCLGAGEKEEAKRVGLRILLTGSLMMSIVAMFLLPWVPAIAAHISDDLEVQAQAISYMRYNLFSTPFTVSSMILGGIMTGAGATIYPFIIYGSATWLVRLPLAWYLGHILWQDASGIFLAMLLSQIFQATTMMYIFLRRDWSRFAMNAQKSKFE